MAKIIDGKALSRQVREQLKQRVAVLRQKGITPGLAVILVGDDPASQIYVANKERACAEVGIYSEVLRMPADTTQEQLLQAVEQYNEQENIHGLLVQFPLPAHLSKEQVLAAISPQKDVDGLTAYNAGALFSGEKGLVSCTPKGIIQLIKSTGIQIAGKHAVVVGRSNLVGKPVAMLLLAENATVTICHSHTADLSAVCREADILVAAIGKSEFITGDYVKPGAIVIDVGMCRVEGRLTGDVHFASASEVAGYITPVPGGVGPMTITMLLENTLDAAEGQHA